MLRFDSQSQSCPSRETSLCFEAGGVGKGTVRNVGVVCWVREGDSRESGPYQQCEILDKKDTDLYTLRLLNDPKSKVLTKSLTEMLGGNDANALAMHDLTKLMFIPKLDLTPS